MRKEVSASYPLECYGAREKKGQPPLEDPVTAGIIVFKDGEIKVSCDYLRNGKCGAAEDKMGEDAWCIRLFPESSFGIFDAQQHKGAEEVRKKSFTHVIFDGKELTFTRSEQEILEYLKNNERFVQEPELIQAIWGDYHPDKLTEQKVRLTQRILILRKKLAEQAGDAVGILNKYKEGYKFVDPDNRMSIEFDDPQNSLD